MVKTPEASDHTSIQRRIYSLKPDDRKQQSLAEALFPLVGNPRESVPQGLPFHLDNYLELADWTGRIIRNDKRGAISASLPPTLERLEIDPKHWLFMTTKFERRFKNLVGYASKLKKVVERLGYQRAPGLAACKTAFK